MLLVSTRWSVILLPTWRHSLFHTHITATVERSTGACGDRHRANGDKCQVMSGTSDITLGAPMYKFQS
jgi:hypothetical protein